MISYGHCDSLRHPLNRLKNHPAVVFFLILTALFWNLEASAEEDLLKVENIAENVYAVIGPLGNRDSDNFGNNANFGFIVTNDSVILIDSGASRSGAELIHRAINSVTDKPVKTVINTGGQDHRWLGNDYFKKQGATIIASARAVEDQKARFQEQYNILTQLVGEEGMAGTEPVYADKVFDEELELDSGSVKLKLFHAGHAHTPGDAFIWLPDQRVMFTGDIVYVDRMLGVNSYSASRSWLEVFDAMAAFEPEVLVPGHGGVTTLEQASKDTRNYLVFLRETVMAFMDEGGTIENIGTLDLSSFNYLKNHEQLNGRNAQKVFQELEWE